MKSTGNWSAGWLIKAVGLLLAASVPLAADPINVTNQTSASLATDDALFFTLATSGFAVDAKAFGLSPYPSVVSFSFVTSTPAPSSLFDAVLETPSGSVSALFPDLLEFIPAQYQGTYYSGPVGEIEGSLTLSAALSQQLFSGGSAMLVLQNLGPEATVGLSSYTIPHDLMVSLSSGGMTVGAPVVQAFVDDPPPPPSETPEPGTRCLMAVAALMSCGLSAAVRRGWHSFRPAAAAAGSLHRAGRAC